MTDNDRDKVVALDQKRRNMRANLAGDAEKAKHDLHPHTIIERWKDRKRLQLSAAADTGKQTFAKNAPLVGFAGAAILLFTARKPISRLYQKLRSKVRQPKDRKS